MKKQGFTLVEMIVVIAILGILVLLIVPNVVGYTTSSQETVCKSNMNTVARSYTIENALESNNSPISDLLQNALKGSNGTFTLSGAKAEIKDFCPNDGLVTIMFNSDKSIKTISCSKHGSISALTPLEYAFENLAQWADSYTSGTAGVYKDAMESQQAANGGSFYKLSESEKQEILGDNVYLGINNNKDLYLRTAGIVLKDGTLADVQIIGVYPSTTGTSNMSENVRTAAIVINGEVYAPVNSNGEISPVYKVTPGSQTISRALAQANRYTDVDKWFSEQIINNYTWAVNGEQVKFQKIS